MTAPKISTDEGSLVITPISTFEPVEPNDICDIVTTIASAVLLLVAIGLTINYAINPTAPFVQITSQFSMSLPLLICGSIGIGLAVVVIIQIVRCKDVRQSFNKGMIGSIGQTEAFKEKVADSIFLAGRPKDQTPEQFQVDNNIDQDVIILSADSLQFKTQTRDGVWLNLGIDTVDDKRPVVLFFPPTRVQLDTFLAENMRRFYHAHQFNFVLLNYRGYGFSAGEAGGPNQELNAYLDAEAAWVHVKKHFPSSPIIVHGYLEGCYYASALGKFCSAQQIILQYPYPSHAHYLRYTNPESSRVVDMDALVTTHLHQFRVPPHPELEEAQDIVTDGFSVLNKVKDIQGELLVIQSSDFPQTPETFGNEIMKVRYPNFPHHHNHHLSLVPCNPLNAFAFYKQPQAYKLMREFFRDQGLEVLLPDPQGRSYHQFFQEEIKGHPHA